MKKYLQNILFICFCILQFATINDCLAQAQLIKQWDYRYGGISDDALFSLQETFDKGFLLGGSSLSDSSGDKTEPTRGNSDYWIVKTNSSGIKQWDTRFGGSMFENFSCLNLTKDGGYILGGHSNSPISGDKTQSQWNSTSDYWIVKTDSLGNKQWDKRFGGFAIEALYSLQQTSDGGYILGGYSGSDSTGDKTQSTLGGSNVKDYWIVKIDSVGSKQWDKSYRAIETDYLYSMQQTSDGGYILGGISLSGISGDKTEPNWDTTGITYDFWVVKADSLGNKLWDRRYGGTKNDSLSYVQQTTDGGYILGGLSYSGISGDKTEPNWDTTGNTSDYWLVKIDSLGTVQWDKRYGGTGNDCRVGGARQTTDGGYLLCGVSSSPLSGDKTEANLGARQTWVVKTDSLGNKQWDKTIKTDGSDLWSYAIEIEHDCYVIANSTKATAAPDSYKSQPSWNNSYDYWFIKFCDMNGWHSVPDVLQDGVLSLYPNPVNTSLNILINSIKEEHAEIILQDVLGQKKFSKPMQLHTGKNNCTIDVSGFAKGIYFMQIKTKERGYVSKVVLE